MAILVEYFENAHISCLHYLVNKKLHWSERLFWLVAIVISAGSTYYVIHRFLVEFQNQKSSINVSTDFLEFEVPYPSVVLCEKSRDKHLKIKMGKDVEYKDEKVQHAISMAFLSAIRFDKQYITKCKDTPERCLQGNFSLYMNQLRSKCEDLFSYCEYSGKIFSCCDELLPVTSAFGTCYAFNNLDGKLKNGKLLGQGYRRLDRLNGMLTIEAQNHHVIVFITSPNEVPSTKNLDLILADSFTTNLEPKSTHKFFIRVEDLVMPYEHMDMISPENRKCRFQSESENLKYFDTYSESNCQLDCLLNAQMKYCGCISHIFPQADLYIECNFTGLLCTFENKNIIDYMSDECICQPNCLHMDIFTLGYLSSNRDKSKMARKSSMVRFEVITQSPVLQYNRYVVTSKLDLIVKIGGAVGFYLGFSFLSIAQLFYYLAVKLTSDAIRLQRARKINEKTKKMDRNFYIANMKLKLLDVERRIRKDLKDKERKNIPFYN